ncbi:MAG: serine/threonine-protein kinase [bacterium]
MADPLPQTHDLPVGLVIDGRYEIIAYVAGGGYGAVYRARQIGLGRDVALKVVHVFAPAPHSDRLDREARLLAALDHPRVVPIHDGGRLPDGRPFLVEAFLEGATLAQLLRREGIFVPTRAVALVTQILDGLAAVHALGLVHRDVKPSNVMCVQRGAAEELRLIDFGIARSAGVDNAMESLTATGLLIGSPNYMAPEQIMGDPVSPATDLYAAGLVLYELLAGRSPFARSTVIHTLRAHLDEPPPPLPASVPPAIMQVIERALAKDPAERFASAQEMSAALAWATGSGLGLDDRYEIRHVLGTGSFGEVLLARHRSLGRDVAIKVGTVDDADARARFVREAQILADLQHPGLAVLREFGSLSDGRWFMAQDFIDGRPLSQVLAEDGPLPPARAAHILIGVLEALEAAHARGVVHRDLKPSNIMVEAGDHARVIDFGLARSATADAEALTRQGLFVGTVTYGAPEQSLGVPVTARADIYSVGIVLYELLTGERPFAASHPLHVIQMHREQALPAMPASVPTAMKRIIRQATAKDPSHRFASAAALAEALRRAARPRRRAVWIAAAAAGVAVLAGVVALVVLGAGRSPVVDDGAGEGETIVVRVGAVPPARLAEDLERALARCDCDNAHDALARLIARDATLGDVWRPRWTAACAGTARTCPSGAPP